MTTMLITPNNNFYTFRDFSFIQQRLLVSISASQALIVIRSKTNTGLRRTKMVDYPGFVAGFFVYSVLDAFVGDARMM